MLRPIKYWPVSMALGAYKLPANTTVIGTHSVIDETTGNNGVLVRNNTTGIYNIFCAGAIGSVNQREAASYAASAENAAMPELEEGEELEP